MSILRAILLFIAGVLACSRSPEAAPGPDSTPSSRSSIEIPPPPEVPVIPEASLKRYAPLFPAGTQFVGKRIPVDMLLSADQGNDTYVEARSKTGEQLGFLRDFAGPVLVGSHEQAGSLSLTLVFTAVLELRTIIPVEKLLKRDNVPMSSSEIDTLVTIAKKPAQALVDVARVADVVDGVTEATRKSLVGSVIPGAAYTTRRMVSLVEETRRLVQQAPAAWDRRRLQPIISAPASDASLALALATFLPTAETSEVRRGVYRMMAASYAAALRDGEPSDAAVEAQLLHPALPAAVRHQELAAACYGLAKYDLRRPLVQRCVKQIAEPSAHPADAASVARLVGTLAFVQGNLAAALAPLDKAAAGTSHKVDPLLHLRLAQAMAAAPDARRRACPKVKALYRDHPLLPGIQEALGLCRANVTDLVKKLRAEERASLLSRRRVSEMPSPTLSLENDTLETIEVNPAARGMVTVLVFFSTWCPHCESELPRIKEFVTRVKDLPELSARVRVFAIRTAVERERVPYETFIGRLQPNFSIYVDSTWSLVFGKFARAHGIEPELPTIAVADERGIIRFFLESGPYRDTAQELLWAVEAVLGQ